MKTAFAYWDNRIAPVFDTARQIQIVEVKAGQIVNEAQEMLSEDMSVQKALRLVELDVGELVCGAISRPMHELVVAYGIKVVPFVAGDLREVIQAWLKSDLGRDTFAMPGCFDRGRRRRMYCKNKGEYETIGIGSGGIGNDGGQRRGRIGSPLAGGVLGTCQCPKCGHFESHECGVPCAERKCPKCGTAMIRQ